MMIEPVHPLQRRQLQRLFDSGEPVLMTDIVLATIPVKTVNGLKFADYADALIINKAKQTANLRHETYSSTYTFDQAALEIAGTKKP